MGRGITRVQWSASGNFIRLWYTANIEIVGIARTLVKLFESEAAKRGALTLTLGTDDNSGMTSLSGVDLYTDLPRYLAELGDLGRGHPFLSYQKLGFVVSGVMPDTNGVGRPDIYMSKRVAASGSRIRN